MHFPLYNKYGPENYNSNIFLKLSNSLINFDTNVKLFNTKINVNYSLLILLKVKDIHLYGVHDFPSKGTHTSD